MRKKVIRKNTRLIALSMLLVIMFNIIMGSNFNVVFATFSNKVTFEVNNTDWGYLTNLEEYHLSESKANTGDIKKVTYSGKNNDKTGFHKAIADVVLDSTGRNDGFQMKKSTKAEPENEKYEIAAWTVERDTTSQAYGNLGKNGLNLLNKSEIQPYIKEVCLIKAWFKPKEGATGVRTIKYKAENGKIKEGSGYLNLVKGSNNVNDIYTYDEADKESLKYDWIVTEGKNTTKYIKGATAVPSETSYVFKGWYKESDTSKSIISNSLQFKPSEADLEGSEDVTFIALFETDGQAVIHYKASGSGKIVEPGTSTVKEKEVAFEDNLTGATAVPNSGYYFAGWEDEAGKIISTSSTLVPTGDLYRDNATYTAVFGEVSSTDNTKARVLYLTNNEKWGALGKIEPASGDKSETYKVFVNEIDEAYNGSIQGVYYNESSEDDRHYTTIQGKYVVDHLELNGKPFAESGNQPIHVKKLVTNKLDESQKKAIGITDSSMDTAPVVIKVYFKPADTTETIRYKAKTESGTEITSVGTLLTNSTDFISKTEKLQGCMAKSDSKHNFVRWETESKQLVTTNNTISPEKAKEYEGQTLYAIYQTAYTINYSTSGSGTGKTKTIDGTKEKKSETGFETDITGALAEPSSGSYFVAWTDKNDNVISTSNILIPTGDLYKDGAEYKAVFGKVSNETTARVLYLTNNEKWGALGKIETAKEEGKTDIYQVFVNEIKDAYNGSITGVYYDKNGNSEKQYTNEQGDYEVDHLELNGKPFAEEGNKSVHVKNLIKGNLSEAQKKSIGIDTSIDTAPVVLKVYLKPKNGVIGKITYEVDVKSKDENYNPGLLLTNSTDFVTANKDDLQGSTAISTSEYKFVRWEVKGENKIISTNPTLTPDEVSGYSGKTLVAIYKSPNSGVVTYNINLLNVTKDNAKELVRWKRKTEHGEYETIENIDEYFESELSETSIGIAKYAYNKQYYQNGDTITVADIVPEIDGYMFVGWFDKEREKGKKDEDGNSIEQPATIRPAGDSGATYRSSNGDFKEYTFDAVWLKINVDDVVYDYTGFKEHTIPAINEENGYILEPDMQVFEKLNALGKANADYATQIQELGSPKFTVTYKGENDSVNSENYNQDEPPKFKDVGEYTVYYKIKSEYLENTLEMTGTAKVTVNKINAKISAINKTITYGDNFESSSILEVNIDGAVNNEQLDYTISTTADLNSNKNDVDEYPITISINENTEINKNYNIEIIPGTLTITPRPVTLKVNPETYTKKYAEENPDYTVIKENILPGDEEKIVYELNEPDKYVEVGTHNVVIVAENQQVKTSNQKNYNYTVSTENGQLIVETANRPLVTTTGYEGVYDQRSHTIKIEGIMEGIDKVEYSLDQKTWYTDIEKVKFTNVEETKNPVTVYVKVTNNNTNPDVQIVSNTVKILPKPVTVRADDKVAKYYQEIPKLTATVEGLFDGDEVTYNLSTNAKKGSNSGTYEITAEGQQEQGNYIVTYIPGKLTINPNARNDIKVTPYEDKYDANSHTISVLNTIDGDIIEYSTDGENWSEEIPEFIDVTDGRKVVYVKVINQNTIPSEINKISYVMITPLKVKITADNKIVNYGDDIPQLTANIKGTINDEEIEYKLSTPAYKGADVGEYPIYVISQEDQHNYIVTVVNAKLTIKPFDREIVVKDYDGLYDGNEHSITVEGILPEDKVEYSLDNENWTDELPKFSDVTPGTKVYVRVTNKNTNPKVINKYGTVTINERQVEILDNKDEKNDNNNEINKANSPVTGDNVIVYIIEFFIAVIILSTLEKYKTKIKTSKTKKSRNHNRRH